MSIKNVASYVLLVSVMACNKSKQGENFDLEKERKAILELHHVQRDDHFNRDSVAFSSRMADDFVSVNRGEIQRPTFEENRTKYHRYFSAVEFQKWDDQTEPEIFFSDDGSMAYTVVDKRVVLTYVERDTTYEEITDFAWVAIYSKTSNGWKITCAASTNKPSETRPVL